MVRLVIAIILFILPSTSGTYLPSIFWDPTNPILQKQHWNTVVQVKVFDTLTFVCANSNIRFKGKESTTTADKMSHNLYVKEVPADMKSFDGLCSTTGNTTFIFTCDKPREFHYRNIEINPNQPHAHLPEFKFGKDYMFFDETKETLNTTSKNCTMVFRIHFNSRLEKAPPYPLCPLLGRDKVCGDPVKKKECRSLVPRAVKVTNISASSLTITWQKPLDTPCNISNYSVCYREKETDSCSNVLATSEQRRLTLINLQSRQTYTIRMRAHTAEGPGDYSEKMIVKTDEASTHIAAQKERENTEFDAKSMGVGFVTGLLFTISVGLSIWICITKICAKKEDKTVEADTNKNDVNFCKGDERKKNIIVLNSDYRENGQSWRLPPMTDENVSLYVSDA